MAGFTDEEVQTAVDRFLLKQVEVPITKTGARDVITLRNRVYDLLTTVLLLRPDSYFYVVYLTKNRLRALVSEQIALLSYLEENAPNTSRQAKLIDSTTDLANAQAAVLSLNAGLNNRSNGVRGSIGPAVDRFRRSISRFVTTELNKNVVVNSGVVETGDELRRSIAERWSDGVGRHTSIIDLASNIRDALTSFSAVNLPESSVRDIVSRIADRLSEVKTLMESDTAIADSRSAMLDLLTMRTLLTRASSFRNPELELMPKRGDTALAALIDSDGNEAALLGTVSGPFNYDPGASITLSVNGVLTPLVMPETTQGSRAELRSRVISPWADPPIGSEPAFLVDYTTTKSGSVGGAYGSGSAAAAALTLLLSPEMVVTWDGVAEQLVFQSVNPDDDSALRNLFDTANRQQFWAWAFPPNEVALIEAKALPVDASSVVEMFSSVPNIRASTVFEALETFTGQRTAVGGEEAVLWDRIDTGSDLVADGSAVVVSPTKNLETLGVVVGMGLHTTAPSVADYEIVAIDGPRLTLDASIAAGTLTYYIGPDYRGIDATSRIQLSSKVNPNNTGYYRLAVGGNQIARLVLDRDIPVEDTDLAASVFTEKILLTAIGTTTSTGVGVLSSSAGATALGFAVTAAENKSELTTFELQGSGDLILRGVKNGDMVDLSSPTSVVYTRSIAELTPTRFTLTQPVAHETGDWIYEIRSYRAAQYYTLQASIVAFLASTYVDDFAVLDRFISRLINGARYSSSMSTAVTGYKTALSTLLLALDAYAVPAEVGINNVIKTMREQGFDRALDLLLSLEIDELFSMDADGVSYASWLIRNAATAAREVAPVSKSAVSTRILQEWRPVSYQPNPFDPRGEDVDL